MPARDVDGAVGRWTTTATATLTLLALVAGVVGQFLGVWKELLEQFGDSKPSRPHASDSPPTTAGPSTGSPSHCGRSSKDVMLRLEGRPNRSAATVVATVSCVLAPGDHLVWVVRKVTGPAAAPHTRYTLRDDLSSGPGTYTYDAVLRTTPPGSERSVSVLLMNSDTYQSVKKTTDPRTGYVLLPSPPPVVSNSVLITTPQ
ncbi:hypothetical protein AB0G71_23600 [Streptomyces sp. NPDC020403]|uniref:hypothetical protein n=1 Tax=unclassified Streptomyces TaxID=2593676 RepID=UPI00340C6FE3